MNRRQNLLMDVILFWVLVATSTALMGVILSKYVGSFGALAILILVLLVSWIVDLSITRFLDMVWGVIQAARFKI